MIHGNIDGIRNSTLDKLEAAFDIKVPKDEIFNEELLNLIISTSSFLEREVSIAIDRKGNVISVAVGDSTTVEMPSIDIRERKLSGVRIIHTHPNGNSRLSALDMTALIKLKLDCIVAVGISEGKITDCMVGFCAVENNILVSEITKHLSADEVMSIDIMDKTSYIESLIKTNEVIEDNTEKAVLVGLEDEESLDELEELADACNVVVVSRICQKRSKIDSAFYVGSGKVNEIAMLCQASRANMVIFDDELSASQVRNLEENMGIKVIDRTTLILEIFAKRAKSREGKIQVELAQLKYRLPRLSGLGSVLSRTGGGIGTKGPGEKKLEIDKRRIRERIYDLLKELERVRKTRETQRESRSDVPKVAIVGYTNAGKSTLRNKVCEIALPKDIFEKEKVFEADMLFATLDTTTRAVLLPDGRTSTLTDTVGFIKKLPHDLVEAFKSTLEEVIYSDLLLHVVDVSNENVHEQIAAVNTVLSELGAEDKEIILLLNKIDKVSEDVLVEIEEKYGNNKFIRISAKYGTNLENLLVMMSEYLPSTLRVEEYIIPYSDQGMVAFLHRNSKIEEEDYRDVGTYIRALVDDETHNRCSEFRMNSKEVLYT